MKYKCLVFDHDDTVVNSTATIHYPSFVAYLEEYFPHKSCTLEHYFLKNFDPGFIPMCKEEYGLTDEDLQTEYVFWQDYVRSRIPRAYDGIRQLMEESRARGVHLAVVSHSTNWNILRDSSELFFFFYLKPGYDMARACGVDFAAAGWANDIPQIEDFMRRNCEHYFKTVAELTAFLG